MNKAIKLTGLATLLTLAACEPVPKGVEGTDTTYVSTNAKGISQETVITDYLNYNDTKFYKSTEPIKNASLKWVSTDNLPINITEESYEIFYNQVIINDAGKERVLVSKEVLPIAPGNSYDVYYKKILPGEKISNYTLLNAFILPEVYGKETRNDVQLRKDLNKRVEGVIDSMIYLGPQGETQ